mmetsp:Transcript_21896/g.65465  ORF Transcript_21896/g.65465 Transcript_21896/m.65465 type:complete len:257 (+) Transcript_21896:2463-3233(+)
MVGSNISARNGVRAFYVIVQSNINAEYVERRIRAFLASLDQYIVDMTDKTFEEHKAALSSKLTESPKTQDSQKSRWWSEICSARYIFDRRDRVNAQVLSFTKDEVLQMYRTFISPSSPTRREMVVTVIPEEVAKLNAPGEATLAAAEAADTPVAEPPASDSTNPSAVPVLAACGATLGFHGRGWGGLIAGACAGGALAYCATAVARKYGSGTKAGPAAPERETVVITDIASFQRGHSLLPLPPPEEHELCPVQDAG